MQMGILTLEIQELEGLVKTVQVQGGDAAPLQKEVGQLNATVKDFVTAYQKAKSLIFMVDCKELQTLLILRYLKGDSWPVVAEKMSYSMSGIYYKHAQALNQLALLLEQRKE